MKYTPYRIIIILLCSTPRIKIFARNLSGRAQSVIDANQYVMLADGRFHPNFLQRYKKYTKYAKNIRYHSKKLFFKEK